MKTKMFMGILSTGLEIIAEVVDTNIASESPQHSMQEPAEYFVAKRPLVIHPVPQGDDAYGLAFMPLSPADPDGSVKVYFTNVVCENITIPPELEKAYHARFSKIQIVSSMPGIK